VALPARNDEFYPRTEKLDLRSRLAGREAFLDRPTGALR
jgi:hypothetical protein